MKGYVKPVPTVGVRCVRADISSTRERRDVRKGRRLDVTCSLWKNMVIGLSYLLVQRNEGQFPQRLLITNAPPKPLITYVVRKTFTYEVYICVDNTFAFEFVWLLPHQDRYRARRSTRLAALDAVKDTPFSFFSFNPLTADTAVSHYTT